MHQSVTPRNQTARGFWHSSSLRMLVALAISNSVPKDLAWRRPMFSEGVIVPPSDRNKGICIWVWTMQMTVGLKEFILHPNSYQTNDIEFLWFFGGFWWLLYVKWMEIDGLLPEGISSSSCWSRVCSGTARSWNSAGWWVGSKIGKLREV